MVTVPDELGTETNKLLHQRLQKKSRERKINIGIEKFDSNKQKRSKNRGESTALKNLEHKRSELTSSIEGVVELSIGKVGSLANSTLALFGEGARGLAIGVGCSMSC